MRDIVKLALSSDEVWKSVDTLACNRDGPSLIVTQKLEISKKCGQSSCADTAEDLALSNALADTVSNALDESIKSNLFTSTLQKNAAECASECTDLASATVEDSPTVEAGEVAVITAIGS